MAISVALCVPDWPIFNRHPVKWLECVPDREGASEAEGEAKKTK